MVKENTTVYVWPLCRGHKGYEEVRVPAVGTGQPNPGEKKVLIEDLPEWAQLAFDGYKYALSQNAAMLLAPWSPGSHGARSWLQHHQKHSLHGLVMSRVNPRHAAHNLLHVYVTFYVSIDARHQGQESLH